MIFKKILNKTVVPCLLAGATFLTSVSGIFKDNMKAEAARTLGIHMDTEIYYYIRNANSNKYLDVCGGGGYTYDDIVQYEFNGGKGQMFKLTKVPNAPYNEYTIRPAVNPNMAITLQNQKMSNTDGTDAYLYPVNNSWMCQRFIINNASDEIHGSVEIATKASGGKRMLEVTNSSYDDCEQVQIWYRGTDRANDNWFLEPVKVSYIANNTLSASDSADATATVNSFDNLGNDANRFHMPTEATLKNRIKCSDSVIFLGHCYAPDCLAWNDTNGNWVSLSTSNVSTYFPTNAAITTSFVYIGSCQCGELAKAISDQGVKCVIGFKDNVAGAEVFLKKMMNLIECEPWLTIGEAVDRVKSTYSYYQRYVNYASPVHYNNMVIYGDTSIRLGKQY